MSSDEDDYMSDKFLASLSSNVGLPKRKQDQRQHEMFKKKIKSVLPKKAETEEGHTGKSRLKSLFTFFRKAQTACEHLDTNEDLKEPIVDFYWPIKIKEKEDDEEQVKDEADSTDEEEEENVITEENLLKLTNILRSRHFYCIYCASKADDLEDLTPSAPATASKDTILITECLDDEIDYSSLMCILSELYFL